MSVCLQSCCLLHGVWARSAPYCDASSTRHTCASPGLHVPVLRSSTDMLRRYCFVKQDKFSLERVTKSGAVFDKTKLSWMNGQHLRALSDAELTPQLAQVWQQSGLLNKADSPFVQLAVTVLKPSLELLADADKDLRHILEYPLMDTLQHEAATAVLQDDFKQIVDTALQAYDSGELKSAVESGPDGYKTWLKGVGKAQGRKGKHLFMPMRVALTGSQHGPEVGEVLRLLLLEDGDVKDSSALLTLQQRMDQLREWQSRQTQ